jgi:Tfp pilus assembly protein PilO
MNAVYKKQFKSVALVWASCFILFLLIYMIVVAPQEGYERQIGQQLAEKKQKYEAILKINQRETQIQLNEQMEQWRDKLKDFVVTPEDLAGLTFDIGQIANDTKLDSFSVKPQGNRESQDVSNGQYIYENRINVNFKANFNKFAAFLNAMERHRPVIFVDKFKITRADQDDSAGQVNMDLSVFVKKRPGS